VNINSGFNLCLYLYWNSIIYFFSFQTKRQLLQLPLCLLTYKCCGEHTVSIKGLIDCVGVFNICHQQKYVLYTRLSVSIKKSELINGFKFDIFNSNSPDRLSVADIAN